MKIFKYSLPAIILIFTLAYSNEFSKKKPPRHSIAISALHGNLDAVKYWIEQGTSPDQKEGAGYAALHFIAKLQRYDGTQLENQLAVVRYLLANGADVNLRDQGEMTPLLWAAVRGKIPVARLLLQNGADVNAQDSIRKRTPMHWAIRMYEKAPIHKGAQYAKRLTLQELIDFIILLKQYNADINIPDARGITPLQWVGRTKFKVADKKAVLAVMLKA